MGTMMQPTALEQEVAKFMNAKQKAEGQGLSAKEFEERLNMMFLEGQITKDGYKLLRQIFGYTKVIQETKTEIQYITQSDSNGRC